MTTATFNTVAKYVVTAVNPVTGSVAMDSFADGDFINWDGTIQNDEVVMNNFVRDLVLRNYPVVVTQTKLDAIKESVDYQVVITIHPNSINCDCGKGILCPLNTQQVNYFKGRVARAVAEVN